MGDDNRFVAHLRARRRAARKRRCTEPAQGLHQTESADSVVRQGVARQDGTVVGRQPDRLRLGDQIADREHQAVVADDDCAAGSFGTENRCGERVLGDFRTQQDHRIEHRF